MNPYYDPWGHTYRIVVNRLSLFLLLSVALSVGAWCWLVVHFYAGTVRLALEGALNILRGNADVTGELLLGLTVVSSTLLTSNVFTALICSGRLRRGDRHQRGTRVIDNQS